MRNLTHEEKVEYLAIKWERAFNGLEPLNITEFHKECEDWGIESWEVTSNIEDYYLI
jgi:hypothetical protein